MVDTVPVASTLNYAVKWMDAQDNEAVVDGPVVWASSDDTIASVTSPGDNTATVTTGNVAGLQATVTATGDADLGTGVKTLTAFLYIKTIAGEAVAGVISAVGEPQPIP